MPTILPFLFDNFIEDDENPILDLNINRNDDLPSADENCSTSEILDKIRDSLKGMMGDE